MKMKIRNIAILLVFVIVSFVVGWIAGHNLGEQRGGKRHFILLNRIATEAKRTGDEKTMDWMRAGARILKQYDSEIEGRWLMWQFGRFSTNQTEDVQHPNRHVR